MRVAAWSLRLVLRFLLGGVFCVRLVSMVVAVGVLSKILVCRLRCLVSLLGCFKSVFFYCCCIMVRVCVTSRFVRSLYVCWWVWM